MEYWLMIQIINKKSDKNYPAKGYNFRKIPNGKQDAVADFVQKVNCVSIACRFEVLRMSECCVESLCLFLKLLDPEDDSCVCIDLSLNAVKNMEKFTKCSSRFCAQNYLKGNAPRKYGEFFCSTDQFQCCDL